MGYRSRLAFKGKLKWMTIDVLRNAHAGLKHHGMLNLISDEDT